MEYLAKDTIALLYFLLPGFLAAWIFYGLTAHPKREPFDRVIQALIFTVIIKAIGVFVRKVWWMKWHSTHPLGIWDEEMEVVVSVLLAFALGLIFAVCANRDWAHWILRKIGITKRTSYPSEWYSGFHRFRRNVILHLKGERRLMGWADEWPDQCDRGHFLIMSPQWVNDFGKPIPLGQVKRFMIPAQDVEMVEFICEPNELKENVDVILEAQRPLVEIHKQKEISDERQGKSIKSAGTNPEGGTSEASRGAAAHVDESIAPNTNGERSVASNSGTALQGNGQC